jgi:conserved oligomeric Golgi complex subunit 6
VCQLATANASNDSQTEIINTLKAQVEALEIEVRDTREKLEVIQAASASADAAADSAAVEHEALLKTKATLDAIQAESEALKAAHDQAQAEMSQKLQALESQAALADSLEAQLTLLRKEKEDSANKLSELEVEILELKESQEAAEDERNKLLGKIQSLESELSSAITAMQQVTDDAAGKEEVHANASEALKAKHAEDLKVAKNALAEVVARLEAIQTELSAAHAAHAQMEAAAEAAAAEHTRNIEELEQTHLGVQNELSNHIHKLTADLEVLFICLSL